MSGALTLPSSLQGQPRAYKKAPAGHMPHKTLDPTTGSLTHQPHATMKLAITLALVTLAFC